MGGPETSVAARDKASQPSHAKRRTKACDHLQLERIADFVTADGDACNAVVLVETCGLQIQASCRSLAAPSRREDAASFKIFVL